MAKEEVIDGPKPVLSLIDTVAIIIGIVVGVGIFKTPSLVAANVDSEIEFLFAWILGGFVSLSGVLCYAELATINPDAGGEYYYLNRAFGKKVAFLFAWARLSVIQTGSIALLGFIVGDYLSSILPLGNYSPSIYAAIAIIFLTALNAIGIHPTKWMQNLLTLASLLGLVFVVFVGLVLAPNPSPPELVNQQSEGTYGLAMIFVLLTYGGWNEAAYLAVELKDAQQNITKALIGSISLITCIFLVVNLTYLKVLGLSGIAMSEVVAADLMHLVLGESGAKLISYLIILSALGAMNGNILTGARTVYSVGKNVNLFRFLGYWSQRTSTPTNALLVQGIMALSLVLLGTLTSTGFATMVDYTAPVFWFFMLLVILSLFILRLREPSLPRPFRVPLYPLTPLIFGIACIYMLWTSLIDTGIGALVGILVLILGVPFMLLTQNNEKLTISN